MSTKKGAHVGGTLYKFHWDCGRQGTIEGFFLADPADVKAAVGQPVAFGECLGKHSDVRGTLEEKDLVILSEDFDFIAKAHKFGLVPSGYNPLHYLACPCGSGAAKVECCG